MYRGGLSGLLDSLDAAQARGEALALGIVLATQGSTYQKPGALILFDDGGLRYGAVSGGCLEPELEAHAQETLAHGRARIVDFDTRSDEDLVFGSGTGCRGRIRVLLLRLERDAPLALALLALGQASQPLELTLSIDGDGIGGGHAALGETIWRWRSDGHAASAAPSPPIARLSIMPPPCVLLLGAGPESVPLHAFLRQMGWRSCVVEHRGRWLAFARHASAPEILELPPDAAAEVWRQRHFDAAIAMSHNYALDLQHLRHCATTGIGYVGLLGPVARRDQLLAELGEDAARLRARLHAPVGLPLGGFGTEALALAMAAGLQQHFTHRNAGATSPPGPHP